MSLLILKNISKFLFSSIIFIRKIFIIIKFNQIFFYRACKYLNIMKFFITEISEIFYNNKFYYTKLSVYSEVTCHTSSYDNSLSNCSHGHSSVSASSTIDTECLYEFFNSDVCIWCMKVCGYRIFLLKYVIIMGKR